MKKESFLLKKKICYEFSASKMYVKSEILDANEIKNELQHTIAGSIIQIDQCSREGLFLIEMQTTSQENMWELVSEWSAREDVIYASSVLIDENGQEGGCTDEVIVSLKSKEDYLVLQKCAEEYNIKIIKYDDLSQSYILTLPHNPQKDAWDTANELYETGLFKRVWPNMNMIAYLATTDTYFNNQWALKDASTYGIKAESAWGLTTGSQNIKIAIFDTGVNLGHPDLQGNLSAGYTAVSTTKLPGAPIIDNNNTHDFAHGTKCAGVAAAIANNNRGIAGVAFNCKILPVTVGETGANGALYVTEYQMVNCFDWALNNGADVISISFNCGDYNGIVTNAINNAVTNGRSGNGCVVVACAHNQNNINDPNFSVLFPANLPNVIAVGAIMENGQRRPNSRYGNPLNVVAPGDDIYTTWMSGSFVDDPNKIIDNGNGDIYYKNFNSTSAATPHVAGVAAGILSIKPSLTQEAVRYIIERTASKNPPLPYTFNVNRPPGGTWNNEVGHGLLNAHAAYITANGPTVSSVIINYISASLTNGNSGATFPYIYLDYGGDGWVVLSISPWNNAYSYIWSAVFHGGLGLFSFTPNHLGVAYNTHVGISINPKQTGYLDVTCAIFNGATYIGQGTIYNLVVG